MNDDTDKPLTTRKIVIGIVTAALLGYARVTGVANPLGSLMAACMLLFTISEANIALSTLSVSAWAY